MIFGLIGLIKPLFGLVLVKGGGGGEGGASRHGGEMSAGIGLSI